MGEDFKWWQCYVYNQFTFRAAGKLSVFDIMLNQVDGNLDDAELNCQYFLDDVMCQ